MLMTGIAGKPFSGGKLHHGKPYRHEHLRGVVLAQLPVYPRQGRCRIVSAQKLVLDQRLGYHHKQGRGNTFARDVRNHQRKVVAVDQEEIIEIPADFFGRRHGGIKRKFRPVGEGREDRRQRICLHLSRRFQLLGDPLLFLPPVFLLDLLALHPADRVHLLLQGMTCFVDLLLHRLKFADG